MGDNIRLQNEMDKARNEYEDFINAIIERSQEKDKESFARF